MLFKNPDNWQRKCWRVWIPWWKQFKVLWDPIVNWESVWLSMRSFVFNTAFSARSMCLLYLEVVNIVVLSHPMLC